MEGWIRDGVKRRAEELKEESEGYERNPPFLLSSGVV